MQDTDKVAAAIRELKAALGDSFQSFATRAGISIASAVRYADGTRTPTPQALTRFWTIAEEHGLDAHVRVFRGAAESELGAAAMSLQGITSVQIRVNKAMRFLMDERLTAALAPPQRAQVVKALNELSAVDQLLGKMNPCSSASVEEADE